MPKNDLCCGMERARTPSGSGCTRPVALPFCSGVVVVVRVSHQPEIKSRIQSAQLKAAVSVNQELLGLYWDLAERIIARQQASAWGDGILNQISRDLQSEFPDMKGFSVRNLKYMRQWYQFWSVPNTIAQQAVSQLDKSAIGQQLVAQIPWGHNLVHLGMMLDYHLAERVGFEYLF